MSHSLLRVAWVPAISPSGAPLRERRGLRAVGLLLTRVAVPCMLALIARGANASRIPSAANSTAPDLIRLVGTNGSAPDAAAGQFTIVARDLANNPLRGCVVWLDFSNCPDLEICTDQMDPGATTNCTAKAIQKIGNDLGEVTFTVLGRSNGAGHAASLAGSGRIVVNGALIRLPSVAAFDLDGMGGVGAGDLSVWLGDFGSGSAWSRSDYDGDGSIGAGDLSQWLSVFASGASLTSCAASCP